MTKLKLVIGWPFAWIFFGVGHFYSVLLNLWDNKYWAAFWYPLYNDLMIWSHEAQVWAGGNEYFPWGESNESK